MSTTNNLQPLTFPLHNSRLIEASAGTGKTYTIAALYLRLVLGHDTQRCYKPEEILVVTFTEAATEELRNRIRASLSEAAAYFRGDVDVDDEFLQQFKSEFPTDELDHHARLLDLAAQAMDEAAVHTIHGWCNRMLREHAFASGSLFTQQLNTDTQAQWELVSQDYWRTFISPLAEQEVALYELVTQEFADPEALLATVKSLLSHENLQTDLSPLDVLQQRESAEQDLRNKFSDYPWSEWADACEQTLKDLRAQKLVDGRRLNEKSAAQWFQQIRDWASEFADSHSKLLPSFQPASAWATLSPENLQNNVLKTELPEHPFWSALAELKQAVEALPKPRARLVEHALGWLQQRFALLQKQRAEMGFSDMLTRLRKALYGDFGEALAATIRAEFPIAMVDEFQDTDPVQYAIFDRIYHIAQTYPETGIFLIGDPKQAIYSFRNADIHTYLKARTATADRHYTLATNYRSSEAMVAASNALFLQAQEAVRGPFHFRDSATGIDPLPFYPVAANGRATRFVVGDHEPAGIQFNCYAPEGKTSNELLNQQLADWHAEYIAQILNDRSAGFLKDEQLSRVQPSDIAVLVNKGDEAKLIRDALRQRGIQSVYLSDRDSVFASPLAIELLRVLKACAQPREPGLLRAALAGGLLNLALSEIDAVLNDELQWDAFAERILDYHRRWQQQGILAMIQRLLHDYDVPARLLRSHEGERELTDLLHMTELLQQQAAVREGMSGLLRYLAEHIELAQAGSSNTDAQEQQVRLESDSQLVQVITIHKSKGLQYPLVFLPFLGYTRTQTNRVKYPAVYHDNEGDIQFAFDEGDEHVAQAIDKERLEEDIRKLYVAVTRAQYATFMGIANYKTLADTALSYILTAGGELELSQWSAPPHCTRYDIPDVVECTTYQPPASGTQAIEYCEMPPQHRFEPWWVASYSALKYGDWVAADDADIENALEEQHDQRPQQLVVPRSDSIHGFPKGAEAGTYLHNLLEDAATEGFADLGGNLELRQPFVQQRAQLAPWEAYQDILQDWLGALITTRLPVGKQHFSLAELQNYQAEPEFWFPADHVNAQTIDQWVREQVLPGYDRPQVLPMQLNGMLKGFIDLVFEYDGKYYVADYKSNYLGPDEQHYTEAAMRDKILSSRYDLQYVIYLVALHKLLQARLGADYDYERHVGGAVYLFLRGIHAPTAGVFYDRPPRALIEQLANTFVAAEELV